MNSLFAALLRGLGFEVALLSAGVANDRGAFGSDSEHMTLLVTLEQRWLVDVGFGDSFHEPLLLDSHTEQLQAQCAYRIADDDDRLVLLERKAGDEWRDQYRFAVQQYSIADYVDMCRYHQTSPASSFTRRRVCTRATEFGRVTLSDMRLTTTIHNERDERMLASCRSREELKDFHMLSAGRVSIAKHPVRRKQLHFLPA